MSVLGERGIAKLLEGGAPKAALSYLRASGRDKSLDTESWFSLLRACVKVNDNEALAETVEMVPKLELSQAQSSAVIDVLGRANAGASESVLRCLSYLSSGNDRFGALELKARVQRAAKQNAEAEQTYRRIQEIYPTSVKGWLATASFYKDGRDSSQEEACLMQALKYKLKDIAILKRLAVLAAHHHNQRESLKLWQQVVRIDRTQVDAIFGALQQLVRLKRVAAAEAWIAKWNNYLPPSDDLVRIKTTLKELSAAAQLDTGASISVEAQSENSDPESTAIQHI